MVIPNMSALALSKAIQSKQVSCREVMIAYLDRIEFIDYGTDPAAWMAAIESDRGGFTPRGFTFEADDNVFTTKFQQVYEWLPLLEPYGLGLKKGGSGADISGLKIQQGLLIGFEPDSQRYFDYHHTAIDTFEAVNKRELELGAASITALVYLLDKYGLK